MNNAKNSCYVEKLRDLLMNDTEKSFYVKTLQDLLMSHSSTITKNSQFLGYGILIALFHYGKCFFFTYPVLACTSAMFSITSLVLIYIFSLYYYLSSENILEIVKGLRIAPSKLKAGVKQQKPVCESSCNEVWIEELYTRARRRAKVLFWSFQITLLISVLSFILSSGFYFFGDKANAENQKNCTNLTLDASAVLPQRILRSGQNPLNP